MWLALGALIVSWLINKVLLKWVGDYAIYFGAPILEEVLKSLPAYLLNRSVFHVHFFFGIGEAVYDFCTGRKESGRWAALASIASHSLFGGVVYLLMEWTSSITSAIMVSIVLHMGWNYGVMRLGRFKRK